MLSTYVMRPETATTPLAVFSTSRYRVLAVEGNGQRPRPASGRAIPNRGVQRPLLPRCEWQQPGRLGQASARNGLACGTAAAC